MRVRKVRERSIVRDTSVVRVHKVRDWTIMRVRKVRDTSAVKVR